MYRRLWALAAAGLLATACFGKFALGVTQTIEPTPILPGANVKQELNIEADGLLGTAVKQALTDAATSALLAARPLQLPTLAAAGACPRSAGATVNSKVVPALGPGPIYPVGLGTDGVLQFGGFPRGGWYYAKVLWVASPGYTDRHVLIRGRQIDGANELRFEDGADPQGELHFEGADLGQGWRHQPSYTRVSGPGCYAYQVDGLGLREVIVFEAVAEKSGG